MSVMQTTFMFDEPSRRTNLKVIPPRSSYHYTKRFAKESLDAWRLVGDTLADPIASALHEKHGGLTKIHDLLAAVRRKASDVAGPDGDIFRNFLGEIAVKPAWADRAMIERGQRVHAMHMPFMGISLFAGSLVGGSQFSIAAAVTGLAGNITSDPKRRLTETGMLLASLTFPGSLFDAGSEAHDSLTRVRLLHAALRHWLPRSGRLRNLEKIIPVGVYVDGEVPLNQQDLAITLAVFCYINLRGIRRMGVVLSSWDIKCYVQMWRYAGYVLGIENGLLPETLEDQEEFMLCSMLHQGVPDQISGKKVKEFLDIFAKDANSQSKGWLPFWCVQTFLYQITRDLNGSDLNRGMQIEDLGDGHWSLRMIRTLGFMFGTVLPRLPLMEAAMFRFHTNRVRKMLDMRGTPTGHGAGTGPVQSKL